jgi:hypothetical protein
MAEEKRFSRKYDSSSGWLMMDAKTGRGYEMVSAGLGWPTSKREGCIVVIGEAKNGFYIMDEYETFDVRRLVTKCTILRKQYSIDQIYLDTENRPLVDYIYQIAPGLPTMGPPYLGDADELNGYLTIIRELTAPDRKRLFFGGSGLGARLLEIPADKLQHQSSSGDFPLVFAVGSCLTGMRYNKVDPDELDRIEGITDSLLGDMWDD